MSPDEEAASVTVIDFCRKFFRRMGEQQAALGAHTDDIAIAALYGAFDIAVAHKGEPFAALEWMRDFTDVIERGIMAAETVP